MRKRKYIFAFIIFMLILTVSISVGYSILSSKIDIIGTAKTKKYIPGDVLLVETLMLDTTNNRYTKEEIPKNVVYVSESLGINKLNLNYAISSTKAGKSKGAVTFKIRNTYSVNLTNGSTAIIVQGSNKNVSKVKSKLDQNKLSANGVATCNITYEHDTNEMIEDNIIKAVISYTMDGKVQYYYFVLLISAQLYEK